MLPLPLHIYFEIAALVASLILRQSLRQSPLRWFSIFLLFIIIIELTGRYLRKILHQPNVWLYNLSIPIEYLFFTYIFYQHFKVPAFKMLAGWFLVLFGAFVIINLSLVSGISQFASQTVAAGSLFMVLFSLLYFYDIYMQTSTAVVWKEPMFWIAAGTLLFNAGEFSYHLFSPYLINNGLDSAARHFASINNKLIWVLYTFLIIAFLCNRTIITLKKA